MLKKLLQLVSFVFSWTLQVMSNYLLKSTDNLLRNRKEKREEMNLNDRKGILQLLFFSAYCAHQTSVSINNVCIIGPLQITFPSRIQK